MGEPQRILDNLFNTKALGLPISIRAGLL